MSYTYKEQLEDALRAHGARIFCAHLTINRHLYLLEEEYVSEEGDRVLDIYLPVRHTFKEYVDMLDAIDVPATEDNCWYISGTIWLRFNQSSELRGWLSYETEYNGRQEAYLSLSIYIVPIIPDECVPLERFADAND